MTQEFQDHFSGVAGKYAAHRPRYPDELFAWLARQSPANGCAWDCGCGSGQAAWELAHHFERVVGTDASGDQIGQALPHPRIEYHVARAEQCPLPDASVDLIAVAQALHWFDREAFFREAARVLVPGGLLAVWSYGRPALECPMLDPVFQHFYENIVGPYWPEERALVDGGYEGIALPFPEVEAPLRLLCRDMSREDLIGYVGTWSATTRFIKDRGCDPTEQLRTDLVDLGWDEARLVMMAWPLTVRVCRKEAG